MALPLLALAVSCSSDDPDERPSTASPSTASPSTASPSAPQTALVPTAAPERATTLPGSAPGFVPSFAAGEGEALANSLWLAWSRGDRAAIEQMAGSAMGAPLLDRPFDPASNWRTPTTCVQDDELLQCEWLSDTEMLVMTFDQSTSPIRVMSITWSLSG
jgi:hypothetical protein